MPIPAYLIIPAATDQISQSQSQIQNNFSAIKGLIDVDHVDFADGVNYGKHNKTTFPVQSTIPTFASGEVGLYNKIPAAPYPLTTIDELFINKIVSGGAAVQIPMTASILSTNNSPSNFSSGWTYLPSGILVKWGQASGSGLVGNSGPGKGVVPFPVSAATPVFNQVFQVLLGQIWQVNQTSAGSNGFALFAITTTNFTVTWSGSNSSGTQINYVAIGY